MKNVLFKQKNNSNRIDTNFVHTFSLCSHVFLMKKSTASCFESQTRRERLKSALYLRLKKRKRLFSKKNLKFLISFFQKMSHSAKKCKRGDPLGFINIYSVAKYQKTRKGDSFETLKNFRKKLQCRKKLKGGPFSIFWFCRLRKKG